MTYSGGDPAVCFTEATVSGLNFLIGRRSYQPWGLVFDRQSVYDAGGGPVWYARPDEYYSAGTMSSRPSAVQGLVDLAKEAREDKGWATFGDVLSQESLDLFGNEPAAKVIYKYEPSVVPGLFQTQGYARALLHALGNSEEQVERRLEVRTQRQQLLESPNRPELNFILGETALSRSVGDDDIMREQIAHLIDLSKLDDISVLLLPFAAGAHRGMGGAFTVLQFEDPLLPDLLYLENAERESVSRDEEGEIKKYLELFVELQTMANRHGTLAEHVKRIARERFHEQDNVQ